MRGGRRRNRYPRIYPNHPPYYHCVAVEEMNPIVGVILMLAVEVTAGVYYFQEVDRNEQGKTTEYWNDTPDSGVIHSYSEIPCEDGSLPHSIGIFWVCGGVKEDLIYPTST